MRPDERDILAAVFFGCFHRLAAFPHIVRERLLDVNVFAGLQRHDRHDRVLVIRRRDDDGINAFALEHLPVILELGDRRESGFLRRFASLRENLVIHIADGDKHRSIELALAAREIVLEVAKTLRVKPDDANADVAVGTASGGGGGAAEDLSAVGGGV